VVTLFRISGSRAIATETRRITKTYTGLLSFWDAWICRIEININATVAAAKGIKGNHVVATIKLRESVITNTKTG
jgi:hypothetical protein